MEVPDFIIPGFPKSGTTSLAEWLAAHPDVCMSPIKEPHFFPSDLNIGRGYDRARYEALFAGARPGQMRGEASILSIYSDKTIAAIEGRGAARPALYIVCLRNPVDMAISRHEQEIFNGNEQIADFPTAWSLMDERRAGRRVTAMCREPRRLDYEWGARQGLHVARLLARVPRSRVLFCLLEDFRGDAAAATLARVEGFLGLSAKGDTALPRLNGAKVQSAPGLIAGLRRMHRWKKRLGLRRDFGLFQAVRERGRVERSRPPVPQDLRRAMAETFAPDVAHLADLIGRDLRHWGGG